MFEFQVNENSPRSLKSHVLQSWTGREEVDNEEGPGSLWAASRGRGWKVEEDFDGCVFSVQS